VEDEPAHVVVRLAPLVAQLEPTLEAGDVRRGWQSVGELRIE